MIGESAHAGRPADVLMALLWRAVDRLLDGDPRAGRSLGELRARLATNDTRPSRTSSTRST